jgi:mannose-6-phosphate isomerase-like protein (cupin superfamily)
MRILPSAALTLFLLAGTAPAGRPATGAADPEVRAVSPGADTTVISIPGTAIDVALRELTASRAPGDIARVLPTGDSAQYQFVVLRRQLAAGAELHEHWSDVVFVRTGQAILRTGRTLHGLHDLGQGEATGTGIAGAHDQAVGPGDVLVIPAGLGHQWLPAGAEPFAYLILKVRHRVQDR